MTTLAPPGDILRLADEPGLARIVTAKEALEDEEIDYAWTVLHELELDLAGELERRQERRAA